MLLGQPFYTIKCKFKNEKWLDLLKVSKVLKINIFFKYLNQPSCLKSL